MIKWLYLSTLLTHYSWRSGSICSCSCIATNTHVEQWTSSPSKLGFERAVQTWGCCSGCTTKQTTWGFEETHVLRK